MLTKRANTGLRSKKLEFLMKDAVLYMQRLHEATQVTQQTLHATNACHLADRGNCGSRQRGDDDNNQGCTALIVHKHSKLQLVANYMYKCQKGAFQHSGDKQSNAFNPLLPPRNGFLGPAPPMSLNFRSARQCVREEAQFLRVSCCDRG